MNHQQIPYREGNLIVIYDASIVERHRRKNKFYKKISFFCFLFFLLGISSLVWPVIQAKSLYQLPETATPTIKTKNLNLESWLNQKGISSIPDNNFSLIIPQIGVKTKVISSVDLTDQNATQEALKMGAIHAKGSSFPGQSGIISIFGHSTNPPWYIKPHNAIFYPLKNIKKGDEIIVIFKNKPFVYQAEEKKIISASNFQYTDFANPPGKEKLILFTCWPLGTAWKRLLITAYPKPLSPNIF